MSIQLQAELPEALPLINGDEDALYEILANLIDNALKFTPMGGYVRVTAGSDREHVWIQVADTGMGLTNEEQTNLFKRYYRGDPARPRPRGIGLGLAIVFELVQAHKGSIQVQSQPDEGTTFCIELPRA